MLRYYYIVICILITWLFNQNRNIVCFYGSQTGTAEEFAGRLAKDAARFGMKALAADPEECEMVGRASDLPQRANSSVQS